MFSKLAFYYLYMLCRLLLEKRQQYALDLCGRIVEWTMTA